MCDWGKLIPPFKFVQQGSKILLTTRMKSVVDMFARVLNVERENLVLDGLKEQELLELLNKYAFCGDNPDNHRDLQKIGNDIVKKLRGSPLASKVIGSLLNSYMDFHFWKRILNHDSLINLEQAKDVADVLKLSYYHLPTKLQECFRFCSIFHQDYEFNKDELIKMWMASGFIQQELHGDERPEDIGEEYFNHLFRKYFFERHSRVNTMYVMHDLLHDLAEIVSKGECSRVEFNGKSDIKPTTIHVSIHESKIEGVFNLRNLRTLVINMSEIPINRDRFVVPNDALKETLRILVIDGIGRCELPNEIGRLRHLRFLKVNVPFVRQSFRYLLPNSIYKLYHLQVLEMSRVTQNSDYEGVETTRMTNLVSLRYINLPNQVMLNLHGVHKLTSLQELNFTIGQESGHHIDELEMLNNLRSLSIKKIENVQNPIGAKNANLSKKKSLISLSLNWTATSNPEKPEQVIDNLQPHLNLMKLAIEHYTGKISPIWMRDSSHLDLTSLILDHCPHWEVLPILGQLPHLKELSLCQMHEVKEVDYSCDSTSNCPFPSLERLYCASMPKWESWIGLHNCSGFPNLKELFISYCPNLAKLPDIPFSLVKFDVTNVGLNSLPDMHHGSSTIAPAPSCMISSLRVLRIVNCPKLISLNGFLQQQNLDLKAIEEIKIRDCKNLLELPKEGFGKLTSLKNLFIENSPNLKKLPNLPLSLNDFTINYVAVSDLPEYFTSSQSSGPTSSSLNASLREMKIYNCSNLIFLNGFLQQENIDLRVLETLIIYDCENLVQLPTSAFGKLVSLKHLAIKGSPKLLTVDHERILLPEKLKYLELEKCGEVDVPLLESASQLSSLAKLSIINCANISCIPSSENTFASLITLKIWGCNKLIELSSTQQAHTVNPGNNLVSLKISYLRIDHLSVLLIDPLRSLRFVSSLRVEKCSGMEALHEQWLLQNSSTLKELFIFDASSLRSLPGTMVMLIALEHLQIYKATLLEEIPKLPASMISENITRAELPSL